MSELYSIGKLSVILGVAIITLRRWHAAAILIPACMTPGGHRRYDLVQVKRALGWLSDSNSLSSKTPKKTIAYAQSNDFCKIMNSKMKSALELPSPYRECQLRNLMNFMAE